MSDLVILVPVLGRAHHMAPLLDSIGATTPGARVLFLATEGDYDVLGELEHLGQTPEVMAPREHGDYAAKINHGYRITDEALIFLGASDLRFHPGWFERAAQRINGRVRVVGTNDLSNPRTARGHSTHTLVCRDYADLGTIDEPGKILHEGYWHEFVDDELVLTARKRRVYAHAKDSIVEHRHPQFGKGEWDDSYRAQQTRMRMSRSLFAKRSRLWT